MSLRWMLCLAALMGWTVLPGADGQTVVMGKVTLPAAGETSAPVMAKRYEVVSKAGVMSTNPACAVVYLEGKFPRAKGQPVAQVTQKNYTFLPSLLVVQTGTRVEFPNLDDTYHNIFSYSAPKRFDLGRYLPEEKPVPSQVFDVAGLITLRCEIHEHMRGLILVVDTPYFVTTQPDGTYRLEGVPEGRYVLKAWINSKSTLEKEVELKKGATLEVNFP